MNIQFLAYQIKYKKIRIINTDRRARKQTHILLARLMEGNLAICVKSLKNINKHLWIQQSCFSSRKVTSGVRLAYKNVYWCITYKSEKPEGA